MTTIPTGRSWPTAGWPVRSPPAGCLRRPRPGAAGVVERTHAWASQYGRLRWCTERRRLVVAFWLALASAVMSAAGWSVAPGPAIAGKADLPAAHERLSAQAADVRRG